MSKKVAVLILNWNRWKDTLECLDSVFNISYPLYKIIVVDNNSSDDSVVRIKKWAQDKNLSYKEYKEGEGGKFSFDKGVILIKNRKNYGFAKGNNIGINYILNYSDADYIFLLNNDAVIKDTDIFQKMIRVIEEDSKISIVQPKLLYYQTKKINSTGLICDIFGAVYHRGRFEKDCGQYDKYKENFFAGTGAALFLKRDNLKILDEVFDEKFFAYYEDVDLSWRMRLAGFKIVYFPDSVCLHKEGKTSGGSSPYTNYLICRNRLRAIIKNYSFRNLIWILPVAILLEFLLSFYLSFSRKSKKYLFSFFPALFWNFINFKDTLKKRRKIQSIRKCSDKEIMRYMEKTSLSIRKFWKKSSVNKLQTDM